MLHKMLRFSFKNKRHNALILYTVHSNVCAAIVLAKTFELGWKIHRITVWYTNKQLIQVCAMNIWSETSNVLTCMSRRLVLYRKEQSISILLVRLSDVLIKSTIFQTAETPHVKPPTTKQTSVPWVDTTFQTKNSATVSICEKY